MRRLAGRPMAGVIPALPVTTTDWKQMTIRRRVTEYTKGHNKLEKEMKQNNSTYY